MTKRNKNRHLFYIVPPRGGCKTNFMQNLLKEVGTEGILKIIAKEVKNNEPNGNNG